MLFALAAVGDFYELHEVLGNIMSVVHLVSGLVHFSWWTGRVILGAASLNYGIISALIPERTHYAAWLPCLGVWLLASPLAAPPWVWLIGTDGWLIFLACAGEPVRVLVGTIGILGVLQLWRLSHPAWQGATLAVASMWLGYWIVGMEPVLVAGMRMMLRAYKLCSCCLLGSAADCWAPQEDIPALATMFLVLAVSFSIRSQRVHNISGRVAGAAVQLGRLQLQDLFEGRVANVPLPPVLHRAMSGRSRQRLRNSLRSEAVRRAFENRANAEQTDEAATAGGRLVQRVRRVLLAQDRHTLNFGLLSLVGQEAREEEKKPMTVWTINVRRQTLETDVLHLYGDAQPRQLLANSFKVTFAGEPGQDAGGLRREFMTLATRAFACNPKLFQTAPDGTLCPSPRDVNESMLPPHVQREYVAFGRLMGFAVLQGQELPVHLGEVFLGFLLGKEVTARQVRAIDEVFFKNRIEALMAPEGVAAMEEALGEPLFFMSAETPTRPVSVPLCDGGATTQVTEQNKIDYLKLLCEHYVLGGTRLQGEAILHGFEEMVPRAILLRDRFDARQLGLLISGCPEIDAADWERHCGMEPLSRRQEACTKVAGWFWTIVHTELGQEERARLLAFATGSARVPASGFVGLGFKLSFDPNPMHLPTAHTCFRQLVLPLANNIEQLRAGLFTAISEHGEGFGFA
eukprot:TRINITY_DN27819_c0_g1_i1.p1 TRINITY_DN27819_c0_g1~~TRINITY_DN27819_c0_g1_i1.p1  ORF type:complete len:750 (+),score=98.53 TRINITY_DN27819_c0_g1_i1:194-2251(+)